MSDKYQEIVGTNKNKIVRMNKHIALSLSHIGSQLLQLLVQSPIVGGTSTARLRIQSATLLASSRQLPIPPDPINHVCSLPCKVNTFRKIILLIVQYKYLKSCSEDFYSPKSDPPHKLMQKCFYSSISLGFSFPPDHSGLINMFCTTVVPVSKGHLVGRALKYFYIFHRVGRTGNHSVLIRLNRFFHLGKNSNRSNRFIAIYCDLFAIFSLKIFSMIFLENHIRHREKTEEDCKTLLPSMVSLLGTVESSK